MVFGIPELWDASTAVSTKYSHYQSSTWSPCGQFIAAAARDAVEIRDGLTLGLLSTLQLNEAITSFLDGVVYSPDGQSLAGCSIDTIVIWDAQTGGIIKKIVHEDTYDQLIPVWSLDGKTIGILFDGGNSSQTHTTKVVYTYDVASGEILFTSALQPSATPFLWAHGDTFLVVTAAKGSKGWTVDILKVGPTLAKIKSLSFSFHFQPSIEAISSTTTRVSIQHDFLYNPDSVGEAITYREHLIFDICNSGILLQVAGYYGPCAFSLDGGVFAAFDLYGDSLHIWRYASGSYTQWKEFQQTQMPLAISPTLSSILGHTYNLLHMIHLDGSPTARNKKPVAIAHGQPQDAFPPDGTYIITTNCQQSTITVANLCSQNPSPSQLIDTNLEISAIVLTGNVLLVKGSGRIVAWLLTEEGVMDSNSDNKRADHISSLWSISLEEVHQQQQGGDCGKECYLEFSVGDGVAMIRNFREVIHIYHTGSGRILGLDEVLQNLGHPWYRLHTPSKDECDIFHRDSHKHSRSPGCDWPVSQDTLQGGWIKDPEGKHRMWLPARWRSAWNDVDWFDKVSALRLRTLSEIVIIKF